MVSVKLLFEKYFFPNVQEVLKVFINHLLINSVFRKLIEYKIYCYNKIFSNNYSRRRNEKKKKKTGQLHGNSAPKIGKNNLKKRGKIKMGKREGDLF